MRRVVLALLFALLASCAQPAARRPVSSDVPVPSLQPGGIVKATPVQLHAIIASWRGTPVVVNFWASWCGPCVTEMPRFVDAAKRYQGKIRFLGVDVEDVQSAALAFARKNGVPFPSLADPGGDIRRAERITGLPVTHFYRSDGVLAFTNAGEVKSDVLEKHLQELVRTGSPAKTPPASG